MLKNLSVKFPLKHIKPVITNNNIDTCDEFMLFVIAIYARSEICIEPEIIKPATESTVLKNTGTPKNNSTSKIINEIITIYASFLFGLKILRIKKNSDNG